MSSEPLDKSSGFESPIVSADLLPSPPSSPNQEPCSNTNNKLSLHVNTALLSMKAASKSQFTIAQRKINPQVAPEILRIKENVMVIPHDSLLALSRICGLLESLKSDFETHRCQWNNPEAREKMQETTMDDKKEKVNDILQVVIQTKSAFLAGRTNIFHQHQDKIRKIEDLIKEDKRNVEEKLRLIHKIETDIKYQQGLWEALKDKAVPTFMAKVESSSAGGACLQTLCTLILWAADIVKTTISFHISFKQDQLMEVLKVCKSTLESQLALYTKTEEELKKHKLAMDGARDTLVKLEAELWYASIEYLKHHLDSDAENILDRALQETEILSKKQGLVLKPIRRNQALLGGDSVPGIHIKRDVDSFCDVVPTVLEDLKQLCLAKAIIKSDDQVDFETNIYELGRVIFLRLERFQDLYYNGEVADPYKQEAFLKQETLGFARNTGIHIHAIDNILRTRISTRRGKRLSRKRDDGDRYHGNFDWEGRPITTSAEGLGILQRVEFAVEYIHNLSISSCTGLFLRSAGRSGAGVGVSFFDFNLANASLSVFWDVMRKVVEPGSQYFKNATVEKPKGRFAFPKFEI